RALDRHGQLIVAVTLPAASAACAVRLVTGPPAHGTSNVPAGSATVMGWPFTVRISVAGSPSWNRSVAGSSSTRNGGVVSSVSGAENDSVPGPTATTVTTS